MNDTLLHDIECAFARTEYPGDKNIAANSDPRHLECKQVSDFFRGKHWKEITLQSLQHDYVGDESGCLFFMTPLAFRYYLPSYINISVSEYDKADRIPWAVVFILTPPEDLSTIENFHQRVSGFTVEQRNVIVLFLEYLRDEHGEDAPLGDAAQALKFWCPINRI